MGWKKDFIFLSVMISTLISSNSWSMNPRGEGLNSQVGEDSLGTMLKEQRSTWSEVKAVEERKDAVLANIDRVLKEKNESIFSYKKLIHRLEEKLRNQELSFKDKLMGEYEKRELSSIIETKDELITELRGQISKLDLKVEVMKKQFKRQDTLFRYQLTQLKKNYQNAFESMADGKIEMPDGMALKLSSYQIEIDKFLDQGLTTLSQTSTKSLDERITAQEKTVQGLLEANRNLVTQLREVENENAKLKKEVIGLNTKVVTAQQESAVWKRVADELERNLGVTQRKLEIAQVSFEGERASLLAEMSHLKTAATNVSKSGRTPASTTVEETNSLRGHEKVIEAYKGVGQKLSLANFEWAPELVSDTISIRVKESFYFAKDSPILTEMSKDRLHTLMEIYSQEIFGGEELRDRIESVEFVGHSSPWFQGERIEPTLKYPQAYDYNMKLSINRAREVVNYVFDGDFIDFPYKEHFRAKIKVSGMGHADPLVQRGPASDSNDKCAPYDCERSRRLDIIVHFKK